MAPLSLLASLPPSHQVFIAVSRWEAESRLQFVNESQFQRYMAEVSLAPQPAES